MRMGVAVVLAAVVDVNLGYFKEPAGHMWTYGADAHSFTDSSGTQFRFRYWPQTAGGKVIEKLETGELDMSHLGNSPWGQGVTRGVPAKMLYVICASKDRFEPAAPRTPSRSACARRARRARCRSRRSSAGPFVETSLDVVCAQPLTSSCAPSDCLPQCGPRPLASDCERPAALPAKLYEGMPILPVIRFMSMLVARSGRE